MDFTDRDEDSNVQKLYLKSDCGYEWIDVLSKRASTEQFLRFMKELAAEHGIHETTIKDCLSSHHQPKVQQFPNYLFFIIRYCDPIAADDADTVQSLTNKVKRFTLIITVEDCSFRLGEIPYYHTSIEDFFFE